MNVSVPGANDNWLLAFSAPLRGSLHTGMYLNALRFPAGNLPGLDIIGDFHGCNMVAGRFDVRRFARTAEGDVDLMDVLFEQHCEGMGPALRGELWLTTRPGVHLAPPDANSPVTF